MDFQAPIFCQETPVGWFVSFKWKIYEDIFLTVIFWVGGVQNFETCSKGDFLGRGLGVFKVLKHVLKVIFWVGVWGCSKF